MKQGGYVDLKAYEARRQTFLEMASFGGFPMKLFVHDMAWTWESMTRSRATESDFRAQHRSPRSLAPYEQSGPREFLYWTVSMESLILTSLTDVMTLAIRLNLASYATHIAQYLNADDLYHVLEGKVHPDIVPNRSLCENQPIGHAAPYICPL